MSSGTPLRDRLQSNSPDTNNEWQSPATTPLRISKRDSPRGGQLARRQSSSYNHLRKNNLVSKSPFRSQIPTPAKPLAVVAPTRRVSGEKRARPPSMHEQAENEHPLGFKRRQSKAFQGLIEKEPVTKSPFRHTPSDEAYQESPLTALPSRKPRRKAPEYGNDDDLPPPPPPKLPFSPHATSSPSRPAVSPARPSLVSRRLHGPRDAGGVYGRRARRKTVTFDETCDVVEYDVDDDEMDDSAFDWVTDDDDDENRLDDPLHHDTNPDECYDGSQAVEDSITGLVDSMLQDADPHTPPPQESKPLPDDLETQDGIPYGRTHHSERAALARQDYLEEPLKEFPLPAPQGALTTPPHSHPGTPLNSVSPGSHVPLGRSTHSERHKAHKAEQGADIEEDVHMLPPSPSPAKRTGILPIVNPNRDSLVPRFDLSAERISGDSSPAVDADPFSFNSTLSKDEELDPANLSIGNSEVSLSGIDLEIDAKLSQNVVRDIEPPATSTPPTSPPSLGILAKLSKKSSNNSFVVSLDSPPASRLRPNARAPLPPLPTRTGSPSLARPQSGSPMSSRVNSPTPYAFARAGSSNSPGSPDGSLTGRNSRISREDVHRKLLKKRSIDSPLRQSTSSATEQTGMHDRDFDQGSYRSQGSTSSHRGQPSKAAQEQQRRVAPPLSRDNPTYDGVMSLNPEPQPIDPPRPSVPTRSQSTDGSNLVERSTFAGLNITLGSGVGAGDDLNLSVGEAPFGDMRSALDRLMEDVAEEASHGSGSGTAGGSKVDVTVQETQAGRFQPSQQPSDNLNSADNASEEEDDTMECGPDVSGLPYLERAATEPVLHAAFASPPPIPRAISPIPPTAHTNAIRAREELIKAKKREARRREEEEDMGLITPPRRLGAGRPARRRSRSTGDAEDLGSHDPASRRRAALSTGGLLDVLPIEEEDPLADSINRELRRLENPSRGYLIREHSETIYASADVDKVSHMDGAGDVDSGRAWRTVRRPSDMNEYAKQIRELRAQESVGKAHGKVFVKVLGVRFMPLPLPSQPTAITCTLNNGIHFVTTPEVRLAREFTINQEFELIEHSKLEWTLTFKVRRDPHILTQFQVNAPPPPPPVQAPSPAPPASKGGMRSFFRGSPKKPSKPSPQPPPPPPHRMQENLARYMLPDGTLARAFVSFKDIAKHCDTRLFETSCRLIGQRAEVGRPAEALQVGEVILQVFRLPALPGIPQDELPQSLEECHQGLRHISWHKIAYHEGTLTQTGADCYSWRRRYLRVVGSSLIAYNNVTRKIMSTIDLKKAIAVEDDQETRANLLTPGSGSSTNHTSHYVDEFEGPYGVERSFRLVFRHNQEIVFFADTNEDKNRWLDVLRALIGRIPPNPLWAELVWQKQQDSAKEAAGSRGPRSVSPTSHR